MQPRGDLLQVCIITQAVTWRETEDRWPCGNPEITVGLTPTRTNTSPPPPYQLPAPRGHSRIPPAGRYQSSQWLSLSSTREPPLHERGTSVTKCLCAPLGIFARIYIILSRSTVAVIQLDHNNLFLSITTRVLKGTVSPVYNYLKVIAFKSPWCRHMAPDIKSFLNCLFNF